MIACKGQVTLLQTISIGSSFRFDDLKAYHHRIEVGLSVVPGHAGADGLSRNNFHVKSVSPPSSQEPLSSVRTIVLTVAS